MTVYIFDEQKRVRKIIPQNGVISLIHDEANFQLHAEISMSLHVKNGEHLGFMCVDNRFRIFTVVLSEDFDDRGVTILTATDAIVQELKETIVENCTQTTTIKNAITALLRSAGVLDAWTIRGEDSEETKETKAYFSTAWSVMDQCMGLYLWQIIPYYTFEGNIITGRVIELAKDEAVFRGRILTSRKDANNVYIIRTDPPITRLYATGGSAGTGDMRTSVTFASVSWYKTNGNPADKPSGLTYVDDPEAIAKHGLHAAVLQLQHIQSPEELLQETWKELQKRKEPRCTVEANVSDMEHVQGYQRQIIRMGDKVPIRLSNATMETARVINVKRDYIRPWTTKIVLGEKVQTIQTQVAQMESGMSGFESVQDHTKQEVQKQQQIISALDTELKLEAAVIQLNAEMIQANAHVIELNAEQIRANAEQIALCAGKDEVTELGQTVTAAMVDIDGINAEVDLKATKAEIYETNSRLNSAEIRLMGAESAISLKAEKTEVTAMGEEINEKITAAEVKIDGANSQVDILAEEIRLAGYVTADQVETIVADLEDMFSTNIMTTWINAGTGEFGTLVVSGSAAIPHLSVGSIEMDGSSIASQEWVATQGYATSDTLTNYATKSWVIEKNYTTASDVSKTLDGYVMTGELEGYATQAWVAENFSKASATYKPTVIERYGSVSGNIIPVQALNEDGAVLLTGAVDAGDVYSSGVTNGKNAVTLTSAGWVGSTNVVSASNGKSVNVTLPTFSTSGGTSFNSSHQTTVYFSTPSVNGALASKTVDASNVYALGYTEGSESVDTEEYYKDGYNDGYDVGYTEGVDSVNTTEYYNSGWNDCRDACDIVTAYTISQNSPGTLYVKVGDYYSSVGSSWVQVSRLYGVYTIPSAKQ